MIVPGTDGEKMSKSRGNFIDLFLPEKAWKKQVMSIVTDSTPLEQPKNPDTCNVYKLFASVASAEETADLRTKYLAGNFGYGHAKKELLDLLLAKYKNERLIFSQFMANPQQLETELQKGEEKARVVAKQVLARVKQKLGY